MTVAVSCPKCAGPVREPDLSQAETLRFNQLRRLLPSVTQRMLTNQLRELEQDGFVARRIYAEIPPRVEYSLTERGRTLEPVLLALKGWGDAHGELGERPAEAA